MTKNIAFLKYFGLIRFLKILNGFFNKFLFQFFRFSVGIGFSMVYGAMLTKTNRISRIFQSASQSARRPSYISPRSQLIITAVLVSVQFMAAMVWIVASIPDAEKDFPTRSEVNLFDKMAYHIFAYSFYLQNFPHFVRDKPSL